LECSDDQPEGSNHQDS
ncbi:diacylglycerol acyltransferase, partial [Mycobacterium tuberculosis MAL010109]